MILERAWIVLAGANEVTLRVIPWAASLIAAVLFCDVAGKLFAFPLSAAAVALFSVNYWAVKYAQEVKQYGTDLFVATVLAWLIYRACTGRLSRNQRWAAAACTGLMCYLSLPAIFWLPSVAFALSYGQGRVSDLGDERPLAAGKKITTFVLILISLAIVAGFNYFLFVYPNHPEVIARDWDVTYHAYLGSGPLLVSLGRLGGSLSNLVVPRSTSWPIPVWMVLSSLIAIGGVRSLWLAYRRTPRGMALALAGCVPVMLCLGASLLRKYPVLDFPRLILWMLPSCWLLLCCAVEPAVAAVAARVWSGKARSARFGAVYAGCIVVIALSSVLMARQAGPSEDNRQLFGTIAKSWQAGDCLFVHGGLTEQFAVYRRWLGWNPSCVYVGNTDWPCCALDVRSRSGNPSAATFAEDVKSAIAKLHPKRLWFALPSGTPGAWSRGLRPSLDRLPEILSGSGCRVEDRREYGQVMLRAALCR